MKDRWRNFLIDAGAVIEDGKVLHFGSPVREIKVITSGSVFADLSHYGLIAIQGKDAQVFLQGQLTSDISKVDNSHSQISGYCNPKGRLLAIFRIFSRKDTYYLQVPAALLVPTMQRLQKYILMSQVTLEDASDTLVRMVCSGPDSEAALESILDELPAATNEVRQNTNLTVIRLPDNGHTARFAIYGECLTMEKFWSVLDVRAAPVGAIAWARLDILAGIPEIYPDTVEEFIPQTVNLELLGGISFKKGCYTGQEIVARLQHRGKTKRRMYRLHIQTDQPPSPGTSLYLNQDDAQSVGTIVTSAPAGDGGSDALAVIMIEHHGADALCLTSTPGHTLRGTGGTGEKSATIRLEILPYSIPSGEV